MNQETQARELLEDVMHEPAARARRIAGIYACFYLEDPLLFVWHGLACFVARQVHLALSTQDIGYSSFMARGNLGIYTSLVGATLSFRAQTPVQGNLGLAFGKLEQARALVLSDLGAAQLKVEEAVMEQCVVEQRDILQSDYATLPELKEDVLEQLFCFRLGYDPSAPVLTFPGDRAASLEQRLEWTQKTILPAWRKWRTISPEWVRADVERIRRWAGVKADLIPAPAPH